MTNSYSIYLRMCSSKKLRELHWKQRWHFVDQSLTSSHDFIIYYIIYLKIIAGYGVYKHELPFKVIIYRLSS